MHELQARVRHARRSVKALRAFTLVEIMIVVLIIGTLLNIAVPSMLTARNNAWAKACVKNLTLIYVAKQQWAMDNQKTGAATPVWSNLQPYVENKYAASTGPVCPTSGAAYNLNQVDQLPTCPSYAGAPQNHSMT